MRQAVVIVHGIGEQRPMQTLRSFVAGVLGLTEQELKDRAFSKPDRISDTLELRRLSVPGGYGGDYVLDRDCHTDFYELYWQHLMQGTGSRPVLEWLLFWLCNPGRLNERALKIWRIGAVALAATVLLAAVLAALKPWAAALALAVPLLLVLAPLAWKCLKWILFGRLERLVVGYIGDAFRYLNPDPPNIAARRAIRTAGLTLLRGLHEDELRRYERIILVGHSLGSVIAYDLIMWFWQEQHHRVTLDRGLPQRETVLTYPVDDASSLPNDGSALEELCQPLPGDIEGFRAGQRRCLQDNQAKGLPWLISDLVTLGSPLAHADALLADGPCKLEIGKCQREFPTCPPSPEDKRDDGLLWRTYVGAAKPLLILHHGAPFAVTRWTNLYFCGDMIGGPVSHLFGRGIKDVSIDRGEAARGYGSHTRYWDSRQEEACRELRAALGLNDFSRQPTPEN